MSSALLPPQPRLVSPPVGDATLPMVELDRQAIQAERKRVRLRKGSSKRSRASCSFGDFRDALKFDAWNFFHAAKKTELTTSFTSDDVDRKAVCFAEEHKELLLWNSGNLRRVDRSVFALVESSESDIAGRFGEAIAYLTMTKWGYTYWDRIAVLWERAAAHSGMAHPEMVRAAKVLSSKVYAGRPDLEPDFAFEKSAGDVALMESKGSFVHPVRDDPSTKGDLKHALNQLEAWSGMIAPVPGKCFAIGTYLRDRSDNHDPSLITYVDPPARRLDNVTPVELPDDWIRRGNYGAWLVGMGFVSSGNALRSARESEVVEHPLLVVGIGPSQFVITLQGMVVKRNRGWPVPIPPIWFDPWGFPDGWIEHPRELAMIARHFGCAAFRVLGIELSIFRIIERSLGDPSTPALLGVEPIQRPAGGQQENGPGFTGSIFPDGTLFGQITFDLLADARLESFRL
jgi:hypothetical protein